ncbi:MAG: tetratricopeptide repeat protein [Nitrospinota bacterium]|nr:tetratricopeptide repeat protein [Nitrospinota bacterium]
MDSDSGLNELQALMSKGLECHRFGLFDEAVDIFTEVVRRDPGHSQAYNAMGMVLSDLGRWEEALESFGAAIKINPSYSQALFNRGNEHLDLGHFAQAVTDYTDAAIHDPDLAKAHYNCGLAMLGLRDAEGACKSFSKAVDTDPTLPQAFLGRGKARLGMGQPREALADFDEAIRLAPYEIVAYHNRAIALLSLKRVEEALSGFTTFIKRAGPLYENFVSEDNALIQEIINGKAPEELGSFPKLITSPKIEQMHREATLFVDICESTKLVNRYGGFHFHTLFSVLERIFDGHANTNGCVYRKGLGDGFMAIFSGCEGAVIACARTLEELARHNSAARESHTIQVRIGVDFGETAVSRNDDRFGIPVNVAKRIEGVMANDFVELLIPNEKFPVENRIFTSYIVKKSLEKDEAFLFSELGSAKLRGLDRIQHLIFNLDWPRSLEMKKK